MTITHRPPPTPSGSAEESIKTLTSWLYVFSEEVSIVLENLGYENLGSELRRILNERSE